LLLSLLKTAAPRFARTIAASAPRAILLRCDRPTLTVPDGPLADDDRTGVRGQYLDPNEALNVGALRGRVIPANPFALAIFPDPSPGSSVTGVVGAHVVAVDADTGAVVAGTLGGWSCAAANPPTRFDGSFDNFNVRILPSSQ
jgi:hypothetical protein